ncbi:MAG: tetratricopeptide repeat protein [Thermodesulfobacteriota bacterium]
MKKSVGAAGLIVFCICVVFTSRALADSVKLLGMVNSRTKKINRISFLFDRIPAFDVQQSGQRVRVVFEQTRLARSFEKIAQQEAVDPLVRVKAREHENRAEVALYFRNVPKSVDVTGDENRARLNVNVFWSHESLGGRPGILKKQIGRLQPIQDTSVAEKVISSKFSGQWLDFFREFEWPPGMGLPIAFGLPDFPSPVVKTHEKAFPKKIMSAAKQGLWQTAENRLKEKLADDADASSAAPAYLLLAECLLRRNAGEKAIDALEKVDASAVAPPVKAWKLYLQARALAASDPPYQAVRFAEKHRKTCLAVESVAPWYRLLQSELDLMMGKPAMALPRLTDAPAGPDKLAALFRLRKADALYEDGRPEKAFAIYKNLAPDLPLLQQHPRTLANWADVLYRRGDYDEAARYYYLLSEVLKNEPAPRRNLAYYRTAMARLNAGDANRALLMLWEVEDAVPESEAGFRARLKLADLALLDNPDRDLDGLVSEYRQIAVEGATRQVREEAFFKQILVSHLQGKDMLVVKLLGRFFDSFWGGRLMPEARALLVERLPEVIADLEKQEAVFAALTLVSMHRDVMAQAPITYDFLLDLADSYAGAGFLGHAEKTYLYMLDLEDSKAGKSRVYLPLIRVCHRQEKFDAVQKYAGRYLQSYPDGDHRAEILYYQARALYQAGDIEKAARILQEEPKKPVKPGEGPQGRALDRLAGKVFYAQGRYEQAEQSLSRAEKAGGEENPPDLILQHAEALFATQKWQKAFALYESLLEAKRHGGQAGYRMVQIRLKQGQKEQARALYDRLAESQEDRRWLELARLAVEIKTTGK